MSYIEDFNMIQDLMKTRSDEMWLFESGVSEEQIAQVEGLLDVKFCPGFNYFLRHFNGAYIFDDEFYGIQDPSSKHYISHLNIVKVTLASQILLKNKHYVALTHGDGEKLFYLDTSNTAWEGENPVFRLDRDASDHTEFYAHSFSEFMLKRIHYYLRLHP